MAEGSFEFSNPRVERIVFGHEKVKTAGAEAARFGASRALVVVSPSVVKTPLMEKIRGALGGRCAGVFDRVQPHSPTEVIEKAASQARAARADILISVGGGSAIDTAKGIAVLLAEGGPLPRFGVRFTPPDRKEVPSLPAPKLPHIAIPTTLSGGEYSYSAGITEGGKKFILADPKIAPRTVILDPEATQTLPAPLLAASGMNALAHCVEAIYSTHTQALTQAYCLAGVSRLSEFLPRAVASTRDLEALGQVQIGACLAGMGVYSAWTGIHHAIVHVIGGRFRIPHASIHALVLPYAMRWNLDATLDAHAKIARAIKIDAPSEEERARKAPEAVLELNRKMGLPLRLRELGVPRDGLSLLAEDALGDYSVYTNPKPIRSASQVLEVLEMAW
ncbi:MAG: iron-containing alcohol dehydrogenase [Deltaproteobacteria bacterium]|nr:iron-containing alcohol dehydrogenase [Deltaproteobacteria bacterium]